MLSDAQVATAIAQLRTVRARIGTGTVTSQQQAIDSVLSLLGAKAETPPVVVKPTPAAPARRATVERLVLARGTNWSCYEDGRRHVAPTAEYLRRVGIVRLPITWTYSPAEIHAVLDVADSVPGAIVIVECHSYGRVGNDRNSQGISTGPLATTQQIRDHNVALYKEFGKHASFCLALDNEPQQTPTAWEQATQATVTALADAGMTGTVIVPLSQASNVGAGPTNHPRPWITTRQSLSVVYEGHHYPEGQQESSTQTLAQLDTYGRSRGFADYSAFLRCWFSWGLLGSQAWAGTPIIIGETAFTQPQHLSLYLELAAKRRVGVLLWADGVWGANYGYRVDEQDLAALDKARGAA